MTRFTSLLGAIAVTLTVACVTGCGGRATTSSTQPHVVTVPDRAQRTTPLRAVQQASINVPTLSWLSFDQGSVWVNSGDGFNTRIDPQTNKSTGRIGAFTPGGAGNYCQGLGAAGGALWSCQGSSVTRIDPERMKVVARIRVGKAFDQGRLVFMDGRIWVITGPTGNQLVGIDTATNQPGAPIKLPFGCDDLAWGGTALWGALPARQPDRQGQRNRSLDRRHPRRRPSVQTGTPPPPTCGSDQPRAWFASTPTASNPRQSSRDSIPARPVTLPSTEIVYG